VSENKKTKKDWRSLPRKNARKYSEAMDSGAGIPCTKKQKAEWEKEAARLGLSLSEFLREAADEKVKRGLS